MQRNYILTDNTELWEWLEANENVHNHDKDFIMNYCCAYKIGGAGFIYYNWQDEERSDISIHSAMKKGCLTMRLVRDIFNVPYYLGADRIICGTEHLPKSSYRLLTKLGFKYHNSDKDIIYLDLPYKETR